MKELKLEDLTIEQKIGQLICVRGFIDEADKEFVFEMLEKKAVGAVQIRYREGCEELIAQIKQKAGYPLLICADMEHGFPGSNLSIAEQMAISCAADEEAAYEFGRVTAIEAKNAGYNVVWGPVVDLASEGALCKITRCFSDDPKLTARYACAVIRGYQDEGMVCTAKHFPGGSDDLDDSHIAADGASYMTAEELLAKDFIPYIEAINNAELSGIMTRHAVLKNIDSENYATFSKKVIDIIRELGFDGLIFTDSMAMMAIAQKYGMGECLPKAIAAGNDIVLPNYRLSFRESYNYMMEGYKSGELSEERINNAVRHVLEAQHKTMKQASADKVSERQREIIENLGRSSLCAVTSPGTEVMLNAHTKKLFVILCENSYPEINAESLELMIPDWFSRKNAERRKEQILREFPGSDVIIVNEFPNQLETEDVCLGISQADETIFFTFCRQSSYLASDSLTKRMEYIIKANAGKISAIVHLGNPYEIKKFKGIDRIIYGVPGGNCAEEAIKALKGEFVPKGKIPVKL